MSEKIDCLVFVHPERPPLDALCEQLLESAVAFGEPIDGWDAMMAPEDACAAEVNGRPVVVLPGQIGPLVGAAEPDLEAIVTRLSTGGRVGAFSCHTGIGYVAVAIWKDGRRVRTLIEGEEPERDEGRRLACEESADTDSEWAGFSLFSAILADMLDGFALWDGDDPPAFRQLRAVSGPSPVPRVWAAQQTEAQAVPPRLLMPKPSFPKR